jgi:hypothetical protein
MAKKLILIAIFILGCSVFTVHNESMATSKVSSAPGSGDPGIGRQHKYRPPYSILTSRYVSRSTLKRSIDHNNGVRIKILLNGIDNTDIEDFSMEYDSGNEYRMGNTYGIENSSLPLYVKVTYRSWNTFHAVQSDVTYEFVVYYPGTWDVTICN